MGIHQIISFCFLVLHKCIHRHFLLNKLYCLGLCLFSGLYLSMYSCGVVTSASFMSDSPLSVVLFMYVFNELVFMPLVRYLGCKFKFYQSSNTDYIVNYDNCWPMVDGMYTHANSSPLRMIQHKNK